MSDCRGADGRIKGTGRVPDPDAEALPGPGTRLASARLMGVAFSRAAVSPSLPAAIGWQVSV